MRLEVLGKANRWRLGAPRELNKDGRLIDSAGEPINLVLRPTVFQSDEAMAIDDLKRWSVNKFCDIEAPIALPSWGRVVGRILPINSRVRTCGLSKVDRDAEYENLPTPPIRILNFAT